MTFSPAAFPTEWDEASSAQLTVAVAECPPFVIIENGQYSGLAVYLWEQVGLELTLWSVVTGFFTSPRVLNAILIILGIAALIGAVFYLLEHRINKKLFSSNSLMGRILEPLIIGLMFVTSGPIRFYRFKTLTVRMQPEWREKNLEYLGK